MQIVKKGVPIEAKVLSLATIATGLIQTVSATIMIISDSPTMALELANRIIDELHRFMGGVYFTNISGGITEFIWIVEVGLITIAVGFFMLKGYKLAWIANIVLIGFRIVTIGQVGFFLYPIVLNGIILYLTFNQHTRGFFLRPERNMQT